MGARDLRLPWQPLDPDGDGILARVVYDAGMGHVAVFESAGAARAACDAVNRGEGRESELREATGELERVRGELTATLIRLAGMRAALETSEGRPLTDRTARERAEAKLARSLDLWREWTRTDITEDDDLWAEFTNRVHALLEEP